MKIELPGPLPRKHSASLVQIASAVRRAAWIDGQTEELHYCFTNKFKEYNKGNEKSEKVKCC